MAAPVRNRELFYAGLLGLTVLLPAPGFLLISVTGSASVSLLARLLAPSTIGAMHAAFVLLPALLAFLAISLPAAVRTLMRARPSRPELLRIAVVASAIVVYLASAAAGLGALAALLVIFVASLRPAAPLFVRVAPWLAPRAALFAGACWLGVAWYEVDIVRGAEASFAIAPTLAVLAMDASILALLAATIRCVGQPAPGWLRATIAGWCAVVLALLSPRLAFVAADTSQLMVEIAVTVVAAVLGGASAFAGRNASWPQHRRGKNLASSPGGDSHTVGAMENS